MVNQVLYLENDHLWAGLVEPNLARYGQVRVINNEHEFMKAIDNLTKYAAQWPRLVVLEQRVRWTNPAPSMPERPPEVKQGGYVHAGVRCYEYLRRAQRDSHKVPVIFFSIDPSQVSEALQKRGIRQDPMDYQCVEKDESFVRLREAIERVL